MSVRSSSTLTRTPAQIDAIPEYKTLNTIMKTAFKPSTPQLTEMLKDYENLVKVGDQFVSFINAISEERVQMTKAGATLIDRSVRYIINTALDNARLANGYQKTASSLRSTMSAQSQLRSIDDIEEIKIRLAEALTFIEDLQTQNKENQKDQAQLAQEIEILYRDGSRLKEKFLQNKRAYEDQLSNCQATNQVLEDKLRDSNGQLLLIREKVNSMKVQLSHAGSEIEGLNDENASLKKQLADRKKLLVKSRQALEQSKHQIAEGKINMKRLLNELEALKVANIQPTPTTLDKMSAENFKLQQKIQELTAVNEECEKKIEKMERENDNNLSMNDKKADSAFRKQNKNLTEANETNELLKQNISDLEEKYSESQETVKRQIEELNLKERELDEMKCALGSIDKLLTENKITADDIPKVVELANDHPRLMSSIQKLRSSLDALCRFTKKLIEEEEADPQIIDRNAPLFKDEDLREEIVKRIEDLRDYAHELLSETDLDTVLLYDAIFGFTDNVQALIDNTKLKHENNIYAGLIILVAILNKSQKFVGQTKSALSSAYKLLPFKRSSHNATDVAQYLVSLQNPLKRCRAILKKEFGKYDAKADTVDQFNCFVDNVEDLLTGLNNEIRPAINYKRTVLNMPSVVVSEIEKLKEKIDVLVTSHDKYVKETEESYQKRIVQLITDLEKAKSTGNITERFNDIIQRKDEEIRKAKSELSEIQDHSLMTETKASEWESKSIEIEMNANVIRHQRDRLQSLLDQRTKSYEEQLNDVLANTNQKIEAEVIRATKKHNVEREELVKKLDAKAKKLKEVKAQIKEVATSFESIIQHQRSEMSALVEQNSRLSKRVAKYKTIAKSKQAAQASLEKTSRSNNNTISQETSLIDDQDDNNNYKPHVRTPAPSVAGTYGGIPIPPQGQPPFSASASTTGAYSQSNALTMNSPSIGQSTPRSNGHERPSEQILDLLQEIGSILTPFSGGVKPSWTKPRVLSTIQDLVQRASDAPPAVNANDEWKKWAAGIIVSSKNNLSPDEMRSMIKEMVSAAPSTRLKLADKVNSLREQKKLLLMRGNLLQQKNSFINLNWKIFFSFVRCARVIAARGRNGSSSNNNYSSSNNNNNNYSIGSGQRTVRKEMINSQTPNKRQPSAASTSSRRSNLSTPIRSRTPMK